MMNNKHRRQQKNEQLFGQAKGCNTDEKSDQQQRRKKIIWNVREKT